MAVEPRLGLKLSIWRDFAPDRRLGAWDGEGKHRQLPDPGFNLQEEVYSWPLREDFRSSISDDEARRRLEGWIRRLDPSHPPSERRFDVLDGFVSEAEGVLESGAAGLSPILDSSADDEDTPAQMNALLALTLHLKWLSRCFADRPGISVSIR